MDKKNFSAALIIIYITAIVTLLMISASLVTDFITTKLALWVSTLLTPIGAMILLLWGIAYRFLPMTKKSKKQLAVWAAIIWLIIAIVLSTWAIFFPSHFIITPLN